MSERPQPPSISIIIVSHNVRDLLLECLKSLAGCAAELIVVDNASSDGTAAAVREVAPCARLIANDQNVGFARASNQGLAVAAGRYLVLLNPDTRVCEGATDVLVRAMADRPDCAIVGARLLNPDGSVQSTGCRFPTAWSIVRDQLVSLVLPPRRPQTPADTSPTERVEDCDWVSGACMMIRREVLDQVGGLDEGYFLYGEDKDLCYRVRAAGWRVACAQGAKVIHHRRQSARQAPLESLEAFTDSQFRFLGKFGPAGHRWLFGVTAYVAYRVRQAASAWLAWVRPAQRASWQSKRAAFAAGARRCAEHLAGKR